MTSRFILILLAAFNLQAAAQDAPSVQTDRPGAKLLPLPKSDDAFHFMVFGDRTGGPPEGLLVLAQAVNDTNLLDPDLVMTVGDLINGYTPTEQWKVMAKDYLDVMKGLKMPWYPVAGNHDVYWRGAGRPPQEHEDNYEQTFGPLWYFFEHKKCGFIVLFSDEGDGTGEQRDFTKASNQRMSESQRRWLAATLAKMKALRHVFCFLHHPRWVQKTYPNANWDDAHGLLKEAGNVRAVFAGHVHRMRYDGNRDGIDYITLATTGGSMPGHFPEAGYLHHMNVVSVRPEGVKVSALPVGTVIDPKKYTPELIAVVDGARALPLNMTAAPISINASGNGAGLVEFKITNTLSCPLELTVTPDVPAGEWISTAAHLSFKLQPGETKQSSFSMIRVQQGFGDTLTAPSVEFSTDVLFEGLRIPLPARKTAVPVRLSALPEDFFKSAENKALSLDGKSAIRVDAGAGKLPDGPFTVEAWVKTPDGSTNGDIVSKAEQSEYALNVAGGVPGFHAFIDGRYVSAIGSEVVQAGVWTHLAGVFDGAALTLYVNGKKAAAAAAAGKRGVNPLPLYIGANPDAKSAPTQFLTAVVDEVRLSSTARYTGAFEPARSHSRDAQTLYLFHCDKLLGPFLPSDTPDATYGTVTGKPALSAP